MLTLAGKCAVVTGAAGGLGLAIARRFAKAGARVALIDIQKDAVELAAASLPEARGLAYAVDIADRTAIAAAMNHFVARTGQLDCLVNNAVRFRYGPLVDFDEDAVDAMLDVGIKGTLWSTQAAIPHLARAGGSIINMSSVAVSFAIRNAAVYTLIKGAIDALTRQLAGDLGPQSIRVNAVAPGSVKTPGTMPIIDADGWQRRERLSPLGRLVEPEDVAGAALFLASDAARTITGVTLLVDAGMTILGP